MLYFLCLCPQCETQLPHRDKRGGIQNGGRVFMLSYQNIFRQNNSQCFIVKFLEYGKSWQYFVEVRKKYIDIENQ